jgi:hypothetical protein
MKQRYALDDEKPLFGRVTQVGTRALRSGQRFLFHGHTLQYLHYDADTAILVYLNQSGRLADCPDCFTTYTGPRQLYRNGPDSPYGFTLDVAFGEFVVMHSECARPILRLRSLVA